MSSSQIKTQIREFYDFLRQLLDKTKIDAVCAENFHFSLPPGFSLALNMACFEKRVPIVLRLHSYASSEIQQELLKILFWDRLVCVSKSGAGDCFSKGIPVKQLVTKYLGVNTREFNPGLDRTWLKRELRLPVRAKVVLHASRIIIGTQEILAAKGITILLDAFSKISATSPDYRLVMAIGKAPSWLKSEFQGAWERLQGFIKLHNIENRVTCHTFELAAMPLVYAGADAFVLASQNESFGQVYIEAMASGTPVIGTNTGGVPEIITDNVNGFLISPDNASLLAQKIELLLSNDDLRHQFIASGLETVRQKFTASRQISRLLHFLGEVKEKP